ncbi:class I SAM-dependent methyltransferase [Microbacterium sp.]|uniref:class I SAM-dependent methyltransferase n=1 Tax=Microbacterium sp. TaxID=51671 RepID=UPI0039E5DFC1
MLARAAGRFPEGSAAQLVLGDLLTAAELDGRRFDAITAVAVIHHLPLVPALERMRDLLAPALRVVPDRVIMTYAFRLNPLEPDIVARIKESRGPFIDPLA